mgnify:CR=1 FL=1
MHCLLYSKLNDASIKQATITLTFSIAINGIIGYKFTLGIPFAGYINTITFPNWIGIISHRSIFYIYGFCTKTVKGGGLCDEGFNLINNMDATIFYLK